MRRRRRSWSACCLVGTLSILLGCGATNRAALRGADVGPDAAPRPGGTPDRGEAGGANPTVSERVFEVRVCDGSPCLPGRFSMSRQALDRMLAVAESERRCREALQQVPESDGWEPWIVLVVGGVAVLAVGAGAFAAGCLAR